MPSPFPGMDPYLERPTLWPNVHQRLITYAGDQLQAQLGERYFVAIGERVYLETPERPGYVPDLHLIQRPAPRPAIALEADQPDVVVIDVTEVREVYLEIQDAQTGSRVVTVVEVLSPANKRPGAGRELYLRKQSDVLASGSHLVEVDLLRGGEPTVSLPLTRQRQSPYRVVVSRADDRARRELYAVQLRERLPRVRIPLRAGEPDAVLDLGGVFQEAYERGAYGLRAEYERDPEPPLAPEDAAWARERVAASGR